ncbi:unnamed protein product [Blepharisma stoltei]|uniref:Uncharacterized protein n=1 Tax=Blepharisma stoltei TaxID=1481888 RepID=A0AAU9IJE1_9CILI|nr:unnamed protein product [Blepharisma stoltei]
MDVLKFNSRPNESDRCNSSSPVTKISERSFINQIEKIYKSPNDSCDSNIKTVPSDHYLERRFKPYHRASRQVNSVIKTFNRRRSPYFDQAKEDLNTFLQKLPSNDQFAKSPIPPKINEDKKIQSQRSLRSENQRSRENSLREISPKMRRFLISQSLSNNSAKVYQDSLQEYKLVESISSIHSKGPISKFKLRNHQRYRSLEFGLNISKISDNSLEKFPVIHSHEQSNSASPNKKKPKQLLVHLGVSMSEN